MNAEQTTTEAPHFMKTEAAASYLARRGVMRTKKTLDRLRCTGGGPAFHKIGREVGYTESALNAFAREIISPPLKSTRESIAA